MKRSLFILMLLYIQMTSAQECTQDLWSDTWVATDGLGRAMPTSLEVGDLKTDKPRTVGIFYITWHTRNNHNGKPYTADVTKVLAQDDSCRFDMHRPAWKDQFLHWGEPEYGYFLSQDEYVCRHDISMLTDAGVDVLIMDVTNATFYWDEWEVLFSTMEKMKAEGNQVPKMCFWAFNGNVYNVVQQLYNYFYRTPKYQELWFYWEGKPLLLYNANPQPIDSNGARLSFKENADYSPEVKSFFTLRNMWWGYKEWNGKPYVGTEDNWCFGYELNDSVVASKTPFELATPHKGTYEQMAVTPAQHPITITGKSWRRETKEPDLGKGDMPIRAYVPWLGNEVEAPTTYGIYFQDRWDEALLVDPSFIYLNDWNEWSAGRWPGSKFLHRKMDLVFIDQYNAEFNRTIAPVKDKKYGDNFYMQMVQNIRRYKGVRPIPQNYGISKFRVNGNFLKWNSIPIAYYDTRGDITHRDEDGYGDLHYTNNSGRNDITQCKVAVTHSNLLFYVETSSALSPHTDHNWMLLLIDADQNPETGWCGYDYMVNRIVVSGTKTTLMRYENGNWIQTGILSYAYQGNQLELSVPRKIIGGKGNSLSFDFKWIDNPVTLEDAISLCTDGDAAPNRRFNYRYIWKKDKE